ncbi:MAG: hypothetical protein RIE53_08230 [Rhodothermales bacterium]
MNRFYTIPILMVLLATGVFFQSGCVQSRSASGAQGSSQHSGPEITVEGMVNSFGAEPFAAVILNSDERNSWVLELSAEDRDRLMMPARVRATGTVYAADWQGRLRAHMRVRELILLDQ